MKCRKLYQAKEFAKRLGISVRTLHHYDHLDLLKPNTYTNAGYRLYSEEELFRLQQITTLKFLGFSLKQIKDFFKKNPPNVLMLFRLQREAIKEKRKQLDMAIEAIDKAEDFLKSSQEIDWESFKQIIEVINMQNNMEWVKKYYTEEQLNELAKMGTPEVLKKAQDDWTILIKDVESVLGQDPSSPKAQELAKRWNDLIYQFTQGNSAIEGSLKNLYSDQANWPDSFKRPWSNEVESFINKALTIYKTKFPVD
jgi:DNA-binding transcriptional MerR regulator